MVKKYIKQNVCEKKILLKCNPSKRNKCVNVVLLLLKCRPKAIKEIFKIWIF